VRKSMEPVSEWISMGYILLTHVLAATIQRLLKLSSPPTSRGLTQGRGNNAQVLFIMSYVFAPFKDTDKAPPHQCEGTDCIE
jgi:hypothetical protein